MNCLYASPQKYFQTLQRKPMNWLFMTKECTKRTSTAEGSISKQMSTFFFFLSSHFEQSCSILQAIKVCICAFVLWERTGMERKKELSSDYNYGTWHLADFKSAKPNFTKPVNGGSKLARSLPNQKFALYNFTQSDFSTVIQCNQVIRGEH